MTQPIDAFDPQASVVVAVVPSLKGSRRREPRACACQMGCEVPVEFTSLEVVGGWLEPFSDLAELLHWEGEDVVSVETLDVSGAHQYGIVIGR